MAYTLIFVILAFSGAAFGQTSTQRPTNCTCGINRYNNEGMGQQVTSRIVGGFDARMEEYPWRVAMYKATDQGLQYFCAANLISESLLITAAHCFTNSDKETYFAGLGFTNISGLSQDSLIRIDRVVSHEDYSGNMFFFSTFANDIALLRLERAVAFSDAIRPSCLPFALQQFNFTNVNAIASGWGDTSHLGQMSEFMQVVELPIYNRDNCSRTFPMTVGLLMTNESFCTYRPRHDTCQGDSGGGVDLLRISRSGQGTPLSMTAGIVSWGFGCARPMAPGVYTKVDSYLDWILKNAQDLVQDVYFCGQNGEFDDYAY